MMLLILLVYSIMTINGCDDMAVIRDQYHTIDSKDQLNSFIAKLELNDCMDAIPYHASATMQKAQYSFWPTAKLKYFKRGKKMLEAFIKSHPDNIEARYVRYLVQSEIPGILGYNDDMDEDYAYILSNIANTQLPKDYKTLILNNVERIKIEKSK